MDNNVLFNQLLHLTGCGKDKENLLHIFALGGMQISKSKIRSWRMTPETDKYGKATRMTDQALQCFMNGLFEYRNQKIDKGINVFNFPNGNTKEG